MVAVKETTKWTFKGEDLPIDTVTVYRPSGAQIVRKLDLDLKVCVIGPRLDFSGHLTTGA